MARAGTVPDWREDEPGPAALAEAARLMQAGEHEAAFHLIKSHWLANPDATEAPSMLAQLMGKVGLTALQTDLENLASKDCLGEPGKLFQVSFRLIDQRQYELAVMLLERCLALAPDEPTVSYELGFALMSLGRYERAIPHFERAARAFDDFDSHLNLAVSYICTRQFDRARATLERLGKLAAGADEEAELAHRRIVLRRLEAINDKPVLSTRDWLYVHYGTVLVTPPSASGAPRPESPLSHDYASIGARLVALKGVLDGLGEKFELVEFYNPLSRPLAQAFADLTGLPCEGYKRPERPERALLVMAWAGDIIGPHQSFVAHKENRSIFAYALSRREPLPVVPDLVGCLADSCTMPWDEQWRLPDNEDGSTPAVEHVPVDLSDPQRIAARITEKVRPQESDPDLIETIQETVNYYILRRDLVLIGNHQLFARRPEYTAELPT